MRTGYPGSNHHLSSTKPVQVQRSRGTEGLQIGYRGAQRGHRMKAEETGYGREGRRKKKRKDMN